MRRSIVAGSYVVELDASRLGASTDLPLRPLGYPGCTYTVGDQTTGGFPYYCGEPGFPTLPKCLPFAPYIDEMPGAGPLYRTNDLDSD